MTLIKSALDFELILKYVDSLKWVTVCIIIFLYFRKSIDRFIGRLLSESNEISTSFFTAKFSTQISEAYKSIKDPDQLKEKVEEIVKNNLVEEIKLRAIEFSSKDIYKRERTANDIYFLARQLQVKHVLELMKSPNWIEQIASLISIRSHIEAGNQSLIEDIAVLGFIKQCLYSDKSRVRYRAIQLIEISGILRQKFRLDLVAILDDEANDVVKKLIANILK